ncbi:hypothetical protein GCM10014715_55760 [Streptomyces spiralis]|uniref:Uncharacterized protein n=1 Tax=Streptomyces spiralis TaxID=66376 RepID=A0A919A9F3_9ACTN|nr:hypothetical protein GCM10014715_55760 [Streptomyces spiralis]
MDGIAVAARVSPATVCTVTGGKQGLLRRTLIDAWPVASVGEEARRRIEALDDAAQMVCGPSPRSSGACGGTTTTPRTW